MQTEHSRVGQDQGQSGLHSGTHVSAAWGQRLAWEQPPCKGCGGGPDGHLELALDSENQFGSLPTFISVGISGPPGNPAVSGLPLRTYFRLRHAGPRPDPPWSVDPWPCCPLPVPPYGPSCMLASVLAPACPPLLWPGDGYSPVQSEPQGPWPGSQPHCAGQQLGCTRVWAARGPQRPALSWRPHGMGAAAGERGPGPARKRLSLTCRRVPAGGSGRPAPPSALRAPCGLSHPL